jgi:hypothetical protein
MNKRQWRHFFVSVLSLVASVALDLCAPDVKSLMCVPLTGMEKVSSLADADRPTTSRSPSVNQNLDREK